MLTPTEYEFKYDNSVFRTFLINGEWHVTVTHGAEYFDRHQSYQLLVDSDGNFTWSSLPYWRSSLNEEYEYSEDSNKKDQRKPAAFDSANDARDNVVLYLIAFAQDDDVWKL
jgi:hypothetical protein